MSPIPSRPSGQAVTQYAAEAKRRLFDKIDNFKGQAQYQREVRETAQLAIDAITEYEQVRGDQFAALEAMYQKEIDRERAKTDEAMKKIAEHKSMAEQHRKYRFTDGEGTLIQFEAPTIKTGDNKTINRAWSLEELERLCADFRTGGAVDTTEIRVGERTTEARIPHPEAIVIKYKEAAVPASQAEAAQDRPERKASRWSLRRQT